MSFPPAIYFAAFAAGFVVTFGILPFWRKWCLRTGLVDDPGHRKIHHTAVALAGGWAVLTGLLVPLIFAAIALKLQPEGTGSVGLLVYGLNRRLTELAAILFGAVGMTTLGWLDDRHELRPLPKFAGQFVIAFIVALAGVRITLFVHNEVFSYAVTILWILTLVNAFNFMDNMNGLCAGLGAIAAGYFAVIAGMDGQYLVALLALVTAGSLFGFIPHNFPNARAFLGDAGSHLIGFLLAVLAVVPHFYTEHRPRSWAVIKPLLVLAVPLGDLVWVVILRWRRGQPFYVGDTNHLSHRLVRRGLTRTRAVLWIWLLAIILGAFALL